MEKQESTLFVGEFHRSIDEKGRLTIPAGWRPKNGGSGNGNDIHCLALPTPDGNITVYPPKMVAQLEEEDYVLVVAQDLQLSKEFN